jgi:hypothetical protein
MPPEGVVSSRTILLIGLGWLLIATALGATGIVHTRGHRRRPWSSSG